MMKTEPDFGAMQDIPPRLRYHDTPRVLLTAKGLFTINSALRKKVGEQRQFRVKLSPDGRYIALCTQEEPNICFSRQHGHIVHTALARLVEERGIRLPAAYTMEWDQEHSAWVGCCGEIAPPPDLASLARAGQCARRRKGGRGT